jgi:hypothetical protein
MPDPLNLDTITAEYHRLQRQKRRRLGGIEARILTNLAFLADEQYAYVANGRLVTQPLDPNKLHLTFNITEQLMEKLIGRLASIAPVSKAKPNKKSAKARADAEVVDKLLIALNSPEKLAEATRMWERLWWMAVGGTVFEQTTWVPDAVMEPMPVFDPETGELMWQDQQTKQPIRQSEMDAMLMQGVPPERFEPLEEVQLTGDVGSEVLSPLNVFIDSSVRSIKDLPPDGAVYVAQIRTIGWIEENYPETPPNVLEQLKDLRDMRIVSTTFNQLSSIANTDLRDLIARVQGSRDQNDPPMAVVVDRWQPVSRAHPHGSHITFVPQIAKLPIPENPEEHNEYGEIPLVDIHWKPTTTNFWTKDFITRLVPGQRFINKRISQLGEQANAAIYADLLLGRGISKDDILADVPHPIENAISETGVPLVQHKAPPELPAWFMQSLDFAVKMVKELAGGIDLFEQQQFPGQLRGPMAVPMLQEILDTEWGPFYEHLGERIARIYQMRMKRVKQFYPPYRTLHYTDKDLRDEVFTFHTDQILRSDVEYEITIERGSLIPEFRALREARVRERLNSPLAILYVDERTNRLDKSKIAADLHFGDAGRDARESQYRKLAGELLARIQKGEPLPDTLPLPFWDHASMMDEYEAWMATTEFLESSPQTQQQLIALWQRSQQFLQQAADAQQQAIQGQAIQSAVAQASQQAAATAAAQAIDEANAARSENERLQQTQPAGEALARAMSEQQGPQR